MDISQFSNVQKINIKAQWSALTRFETFIKVIKKGHKGPLCAETLKN